MKKNLGKRDRTVRVAVGIGLICWYIMGPLEEPLRVLLFVVPGVILIVSAVSGYCLSYHAFGLSTRSSSKNEDEKMAQSR